VGKVNHDTITNSRQKGGEIKIKTGDQRPLLFRGITEFWFSVHCKNRAVMEINNL
jgi:hypothetical protein